MRITQIIKKDDKKVFVILDNDDKLTLNKDIVYQFALRKNDELSEENITRLLEAEKKYNIKLKALSYLQRRIHSRRELATKLKRHFSESNFIEECLSDLENNNFIDDQQFASLFIQEKIRLKKWSKSKLKSELYLKGISKEIIEDCLNRFFDSELEKEKALELATKKLKTIQSKNLDNKITYRKLIHFLQSKGYDYELSSDIVRKLIKEDWDNE